MIMIASYTANLTASLTVTRMGNTIDSVDALANQNKVKYGSMRGGSTASFFEVILLLLVILRRHADRMKNFASSNYSIPKPENGGSQ